MRLRITLLCLLATALSCEDKLMSGATGGSGGSSTGGRSGEAGASVGGTGGGASCATNLGGRIGTSTSATSGSGTAGASGTAGGGGAGASLPACATTGRYAAGTLANVDDTSITAPLAATVTMTAVNDWPGNSSGIRVTLADTASGRQWVWWLSIPDLPADRINGCDRYELTVDAANCPYPGTGSCQTVVLARGGALVAFSVDLQSTNIPSPTALAAWGITVVDAGAFCEISSPICAEIRHTARVTVGTETATLVPYQTATLQGLSISVGSFTGITRTMCDVPATTRIVGFRLP